MRLAGPPRPCTLAYAVAVVPALVFPCARAWISERALHAQRDYVVIGVKLGNAMVTADIGLTALLESAGETSEMRSLSNVFSYFGCPKYDFCEKEQVRVHMQEAA